MAVCFDINQICNLEAFSKPYQNSLPFYLFTTCTFPRKFQFFVCMLKYLVDTEACIHSI